MQITSPPFWLMIVSMPTAVLPVPRSPMISSRWPRPIGIIESIDLRPVCSGCVTGWRWMTPGALNSRGRVVAASIGPWPSSGLPSGSTTRPSRPSPTGTLMTAPVRRTGSPSLTSCHWPKSATPTLSSSRLKAIPTTLCSKSSRSSETQFSSPWTRAMPSPTCSTVPTSDRSVSTSYCSIRDLRIEVISSGRSFTFAPSLPGGELVAEALQTAAHAGVDAQRTCLQDHAADQLGVDLAGCLDLAAGGLLDLGHDRGGLVVGQLEGGGQLDGHASLRAVDEGLELVADPGDLPGPPLRRDQAEEVVDELVGSLRQLTENTDFRCRIDLGVGEKRRQLRRCLDGIGELA